MSKLRVYELARELNIESKVLVARLKSAGLPVASHQSTLTGDEIDQARAAVGGEGASAGPVAKAGGAGQTVVRRRPKTILRRKSEDDEDGDAVSEAAAAASDDEDTSPPPVVVRRKAADPVVEAHAQDEVAPEEPTIREVIASPETESMPIEEEKVVAEVEAEPEIESAPAEAAEEKQFSEYDDADKVKPRRVSGGATIVRRATEEELEELESQTRRRTGRKEDSRGTRVTGIGLLNNRMSVEDAPSPSHGGPSAVQPIPDEDTGVSRGIRPRTTGSIADRQMEKEKEEEAARQLAARTKKQRRINTELTTRALLDKAQALNAEVENPEARIRGRTVYTPAAAGRRRDVKRRKDLKKTQVTMPRASYRVVRMGEAITIGELAKQLAVKSGEIIKKLMGMGEMMTINQTVDFDTATLIANDYQFEVKSEVTTVEDILKSGEIPEGEAIERAPIVTIMGHVDHGKTSILDAIKESNVAGGEAGGITQHIGAYSVEHNGRKICFLDTPGHEAFSAMRARGAKVTDIVILVVAADDGVMPQTVEAIAHAKAAEVPLIVAINKMDKPQANPDRVMQELTEHGVQAEEWGGDTQFIRCSAMEKTGLQELLEAIQLQSEVLELRTSEHGRGEGIVIEAHLDRGRGPVATVVVQRGTLRKGDYIVAGSEVGRARAMHDHLGNELLEAGPSTPVEIIGLSGVPMAGDQINAVDDEKTAKNAADWREEQSRLSAAGKSSAQSLEDLLAKVQSAEIPEVPFIIKGDVQGSVEAVSDSILKVSTDRVKNKVIHSAAGGVTESDITLAAASGAIILGFNVRAARGLDELAEKQGVLIKYFSVIYDVVDAVKAIMVGKLPPVVSEVTLGRAEVRKPISVPKIGTVAGSAVIEGKVSRNAHCRLIRDDIVIYQGKLSSLRRFKDDVKEVATGYECGISIEGYNDIKEGDVIEAFVLEESQATL